MSTLLCEKDFTGSQDRSLRITQFCGPKKKGLMMQITQGYHFIDLTQEDAAWLAAIIHSWAINNESALSHESANRIS